MEKILFYALDSYLPFCSTLYLIYKRYLDSVDMLEIEIRRLIRRLYTSNRHGDVLSLKYHFEEKFGTKDELLEQLFYISLILVPYAKGRDKEDIVDILIFLDVANPVFLPSSNQNWELKIQIGNELTDIYKTYNCY